MSWISPSMMQFPARPMTAKSRSSARQPAVMKKNLFRVVGQQNAAVLNLLRVMGRQNAAVLTSAVHRLKNRAAKQHVPRVKSAALLPHQSMLKKLH